MEIAFEFEGRRRKQSLCTKPTFGSYRLHLEFQCPRGDSGNSGVFFGPLCELQILNSEGKVSPDLGDCAAINQLHVPDGNAALVRKYDKRSTSTIKPGRSARTDS